MYVKISILGKGDIFDRFYLLFRFRIIFSGVRGNHAHREGLIHGQSKQWYTKSCKLRRQSKTCFWQNMWRPNPSQTFPNADQSNQLSGDRKDSLINNSINASNRRKESRGLRSYTRLTPMHFDILGKDFWLEHPNILGKANR